MSSEPLEISVDVDGHLVIPTHEISPAAREFLQRQAERNGTTASQEAARILENGLSDQIT